VEETATNMEELNDRYRQPTRRLWGVFTRSNDDDQSPTKIHIHGDELIEQHFNSDDVRFDMILRYTDVRLDKWAYSDAWKPKIVEVEVQDADQSWQAMQVLLWDAHRIGQSLDLTTGQVRNAVLDYFAKQRAAACPSSVKTSTTDMDVVEVMGKLRGRQRRQARRHASSTGKLHPTKPKGEYAVGLKLCGSNALRGRQRRRQRRSAAYGYQLENERRQTTVRRKTDVGDADQSMRKNFEMPDWAVSLPSASRPCLVFDCDGKESGHRFVIPVRLSTSDDITGSLAISLPAHWDGDRDLHSPPDPNTSIGVKSVCLPPGDSGNIPRRYWSKFTVWYTSYSSHLLDSCLPY